MAVDDHGRVRVECGAGENGVGFGGEGDRISVRCSGCVWLVV